MKKLTVFAIISVLLFGTAPIAFAGTEVNKYVVPNVKDDYCGVHINYQFCKCAFHDKYCADIGMDQDSAHSHVKNQFRLWNKDRIQKMAESCLTQGGYWNKSGWSCTTCTDGDVLEGQKCVAQEKRSSCNDDLKDFDRDWEKYSDFDAAIPVNEASYEVQQFNKIRDEIAGMIADAHALEYDMEIDRQIRLELREYKKALVHNIRSNITKAIFRLAWVTYNTVQGARGTAGSYHKMLNPDSAIEGVGATMKVIQAHIPKHEKGLQFDTSNTKGKVKSAAWNATLETLESVADPTAVATQIAKDARAGLVGGPDLTDAEVAILRDQHLKNQEIDRILADSYALNGDRRKKLLKLEKDITEKYNELEQWKAKEYTRVKQSIIESCKE